MKKIFLQIILMSIALSSLYSQTPQSFKYQAVARDNAGNTINNQLVSFRISILNGSATGTSMYSETHQPTTNNFGLANLEIGNGSVVSGNFVFIDWSTGTYFLKVEMDASGGSSYQFMGSSQLLSVPYALYSENTANTDDADADPGNELQSISKVGNNVTLSDGGGSFTDEVDDADADPDNEIQTISKVGSTVTLSNDGGSFMDEINDADPDPTNELNTGLNMNGNSLEVTDAGGTLSVDLGTISADSDWTISGDNMYSTVAGNVGIGTTAPAATLEVAGHISTSNTGSSVFLGWGAGYYDDLSYNYNVYIGQSSGNLNTTGNNNTACGSYSLFSSVGGAYNTAIGQKSLYYNVSGNNNTAIGNEAGHGLYGGSVDGCVYLGNKAGYYNGTDNRLYIENSDSNYPLIYGEFDNDIVAVNGKLGVGTISPSAPLEVAGRISVTNTGQSVFIGQDAGLNNNSPYAYSVFVGHEAGYTNTSGQFNIAVGKRALFSSLSDNGNVAIGYKSLEINNGGDFNTAVGSEVMAANTTGWGNDAFGSNTLSKNETGIFNTAIGSQALYYSIDGDRNIAIGRWAGYGQLGYSVNNCVFIGYSAGYNNISDNVLYIENSNSDLPLIYGEFDNDILAVNGKLGIGTKTPDVRLHVLNGSDASLASGGYIVTGPTNGQNIVLDENEIMARNNGALNSLHLQRNGGGT